MKCPICKKEIALADPYMPFCGERCKLIDLGNWATEKYVIPVPLTGDEQLDEEASDGAE
jgi:uncharacterized protein